MNKKISSATDDVHKKAKVSLAGTYMPVLFKWLWFQNPPKQTHKHASHYVWPGRSMKRGYYCSSISHSIIETGNKNDTKIY